MAWGSIGIAGATTNIAISGAGILTTGNLTLEGIRTLTIANPVALSGPAIHAIANVTNSTAVDATLSGVVSGGFSLTKEGAGTLLLSNAANSYSGNTIINAGELQPSIGTPAAGPMSTLGTGAVTVNSGATLRFMAGSTGNQYTYSNAISLNNATLAYQDGNHILTGGIALTGDNVFTGVWAGKNLTIPSVIAGTGSINKTITPGQDAVLILQGSNTYSGGTTVAGGTINLDFTPATAPASDILFPTGAVTLAGGNLTMTGKAAEANTQTFGGLSLTSNTTSTLTVNPGAGGTATLNPGAITRNPFSTLNLAGTGTINTTAGTASTVLTDAATGAAYATVGGTDWAAKDAGNASIVGLSTISGYTDFDTTGAVALSGNADLTSGTAGTYTLNAASSPATIRNTTITGNILALGGFTLRTGGILSSVALAISGTGGIQPATAGGELILNQSAGTTTITSSFANHTSASSLVKTGAGTIVFGNNSAHTYTGVTYINQGTLITGSDIGTGSAVTLATSGISVALGATFMMGNGTLSATKNITGAGNFTKQGVGFVYGATIAGTNNNYTGTTSIVFGTLTLAAGGVINGTRSITVSNANGTQLANNGTITTAGAVTVNGGVTTSATSNLITNGNASGTTPGSLTAASLTLGAANATVATSARGGAFTNNLNSSLNLSGTITVNGQGSNFAGGVMSPAGSQFTMAGGTVNAATLTLNNSSTANTVVSKGGTYSQTGGSTTVTWLNLVAVNSILPGSLGNDTVFNISGGSFTTTNASLNGTTNVSGTGTLNVGGQFFMGDFAATRSGRVVQTGGTVNLTTTTANNLRIGHWANETSTYAVSGGTLNATATNMIVGYDGSGILELSDTGTANLMGIQFSRGFSGNGTVNLNGGRLNLGTGGITLTAPGTSAINLGAGTIGAFDNWASPLAMTLTDPSIGTNFQTLDSVDGTTARTITLSGPLSGPGALTKTGAGTLALSNAANAYAGTTAVNGGTLLVNGTHTGTGAVTVAAGATLGGTGKLNGAVTAAGTIAPGASAIGTLTTADTTLSGTYSCEINGTAADRLAVLGNLNLTGATISVSASGAGLTESSYLIATWTGSLTGTPTLTGAPGYSLDTTGTGQLRLITTPRGGYDQWAATFPGFTGPSATAGADFENDGTANLLEFVLGGDPRISDPSILPKLEVTPTEFSFTFKRADESKTGTTLLFQWGNSLLTPWSESAVPAASGVVGGAAFTIKENGSAADDITVTVPRGSDPKVFGRLKAAQP